MLRISHGNQLPNREAAAPSQSDRTARAIFPGCCQTGTGLTPSFATMPVLAHVWVEAAMKKLLLGIFECRGDRFGAGSRHGVAGQGAAWTAGSAAGKSAGIGNSITTGSLASRPISTAPGRTDRSRYPPSPSSRRRLPPRWSRPEVSRKSCRGSARSARAWAWSRRIVCCSMRPADWPLARSIAAQLSR